MARGSKPKQEASQAAEPEAQAVPALAPAPVRRRGAPAPAAPTTIRVANHHAGPVMFPRTGGAGGQALSLPPKTIYPGHVEEFDAEEWEKRKESPVVRYYLDAGIIAEVRSNKGVQVTGDTTADLEDIIPPHLQTAEEEQQGQYGSAKLRADRTKGGTIRI